MYFNYKGKQTTKNLPASYLRKLRSDEPPYKSGVIIINFDITELGIESDFKLDNNLKIRALLSNLESKSIDKKSN